LMGLYPTTTGAIYFDDLNINEISKEDLFKHITVLFQDYIKYSYTAKDNIYFGNVLKEENLNDIKDVAQKADSHEFIEKLDKGYNTFLGKAISEGEDLSGGQWQKIALARSLYRDSEIFILDEPTAALDPRAELEIFKKFEEITKNKTTIYISHRMASAKIADRIIVFKQGEIIETGTHDELMSLEKEYYRLYTMQSDWYNSKKNEKSLV
ncbi:ABC transporter ATP-binding protein, partial [Bacillus cereus]|nr:ABC transporter ATP-binding protein [Bacillus cereus]